MKKFFILLITLLTCTCIVGCSFITLPKQKGKTFTISLYDNSSTGYAWTYKISKKNIVNIKEKSDYSNCGNMIGCGGKKIYTIKALKPGNIKLSLKYSFSGDKDRPYETATYLITVDRDLNIKESHYGSYFDER